MTVSLSANPGQTVRIAIATKDGYGQRADGYATPQVDFILTPALVAFSGTFPVAMPKVSTGLFTFEIVIPAGAAAIGTYIASASWPDPTTSFDQFEDFLINVSLPFGNSSVSPA